MKKCDSGPRADNRGILDPARLRREVRFRRRLPAAALLPYVEHYWLIDWDLDEPFEQRVLPHPAVNLVFRRDPAGGPASGSAEVAASGGSCSGSPSPAPAGSAACSSAPAGSARSGRDRSPS